MRTFIAVRLPSDIRDYLIDLQKNLIADNPRLVAKWVEYDNLHLTLLFFDELTEEEFNLLKIQLGGVTWPVSFKLTLATVDAFPSNGAPRSLHVTTENSKELNQLVSLLKREVTELNIPIDKKVFTPHITLGRLKQNIGPLKYERDADYLTFPIVGIELLTSDLTEDGPIYTVHEFYQLN
jgi:RNA 2',3'-cyclic 3'-phosphodiesterase